MTIIRVINRASKLIRPCLINLESCARNPIHRNASILASNLWHNERFQQKPIMICSFQNQIRNKFKKPSKRNEDDDEDSDDDELDHEDKYDKHSKAVKVTLPSLRLDLIVKAGLNIARNKVETLFYESKIRLNGNKVEKKSVRINIGDEIDVIKGQSQQNPENLLVGRLEIINIKAKEDEGGMIVSMRRTKSLVIENYEESPYKFKSEDKDLA